MGRYNTDSSNWKNIPISYVGGNVDFSEGITNEMIQPLGKMVDLLQANIQKQLNRNYYSRDYFGRVKPISGNDFGGVHPKTYTGRLYESVTTNVVSPGKGSLQFVIDFGDAYYWYYVDKGRKPGAEYDKRRQTRSRTTGRFGRAYTYKSYTKMPPLKDIQQWVETKPALVSADLSTETRTYLAMRSIARDGIYGINFIEKAILETETELNSPMGEFLAETFREILNSTPLIKQDNFNIKIKI
jgi:hypothetical protein